VRFVRLLFSDFSSVLCSLLPNPFFVNVLVVGRVSTNLRVVFFEKQEYLLMKRMQCVVITTIAVTLGLVSCDTFGYRLASRWTETATDDSGGLVQGDATTLTWSIISDGSTVYPQGIAPSAPSNLIAALDEHFAIVDNTNDRTSTGSRPWLENRSWFSQYINPAFARMGAVSGLSIVYVDYDDGSRSGTLAHPDVYPGEIGTRADIRLGGMNIDYDVGGFLAVSHTPSTGGNIIIDTYGYDVEGKTNALFSESDNNYRILRNTIMHESGHSFGMFHVVASGVEFLMEPKLITGQDGPQFDDILGLHRHYGDANEKAGNDVIGSATSLGVVNFGQALIGEDASDKVVAPTDVDFVSIDGSSDTDYFSFTVLSGAMASIVLTPIGPDYTIGPDYGGGTLDVDFVASEQTDLTLELIGPDKTSLLIEKNENGLGGAESIIDFSLDQAGTYYIKVNGDEDFAQFYQLSLDVTPEPASMSLLALGAIALLKRRRRTR